MSQKNQDLANIFDTGGKFSDPFLLPSSEYMPTSLDSALEFCMFLFYMNPLYRRASKRVVAHFVTDIDFVGKQGDQRERDELKEYLTEELDLYSAMLTAGEEWSCYGNSFWRICFPFDRFLIDRREGRLKEYSLDMFGNDAKFNLTRMTYTVPDPAAMSKHKGGSIPTVELPFRDRRSTESTRIKLAPLDPKRMRLQFSWIGRDTTFIYQFEEWFVSQIKEGRLYQVNKTPIAMLKAIQNDQDFMFQEDEVFHFKAPTISGVSNNGWGVPETLVNYRSLHQLQVYRKIDESVGRDYMLPFRLFSPELGNNASDITMYSHLGVWGDRVKDLIASRRKNPEQIHAFPFPIRYQEEGASGKELTPKDLIEYQTNDMLDGMGYPAELFRGSLQVQQIPTAIRLFENSFYFMHQNYDRMLKWATRRILDYTGREQIGVTLQLPSIADDLEQRHVYLQLAAGGEVSRDKVYKQFNIKDPIEEAKKRMEEDIEIQRAQQKIQADFEREQTMGSADDIIASQMGGAQPGTAGGAGLGGSPAGGSTTPLDIMSQAEEQAAQLLQIESDGERRKMLQDIEATNPNLHAAVKQKMEEMRSAAASQGRQSVGQLIAGG